MKNGNLIIYWVATALMSVGMFSSGVEQVIRVPAMVEILTHLGYPVYFMVIMGVWKMLAVIAILVPGFRLLKEWAYAGLFFVMTGALVSHLACGDHGIKEMLGPAFQTIFIVASWYFRPTNSRLVVIEK